MLSSMGSGEEEEWGDVTGQGDVSNGSGGGLIGSATA